MKIRTYMLAGIAAMAACACAGGGSASTTTLTGLFDGDAPSQVQISLPSADVDTMVEVTNGKFMFRVPTDKMSVGMVKADNAVARFIPDGTQLTFRFKGSDEPEVTSNKPASSLQTKFDAARKAATDLRLAYQDKFNEARRLGKEAAEPVLDSLGEAYFAENKQIFLDLLENNTDNYLGLHALGEIRYDLSDEELSSLIGKLSPEMAAVESVAAIKKGLEARAATAVGKKFADFTVGEQKFSDFAGKGKYLLVDFWASWCGPCKREVPFIKAVYDKYHQDTFDVLSIAVWERSVRDTERAAKDLGITWNQIVDAKDIPTGIYGIEGIPHIMLIGPDGTILARDLRGEGIEAEVSKHVKPVK